MILKIISVFVCIITRSHPTFVLHLDAGRENLSSMEEESDADVHS